VSVVDIKQPKRRNFIMGRREVTRKKPGAIIDRINVDKPLPPRLALSIREFCAAHGISEDFYYKLKRQGRGPVEMKVGARTLISHEAATDWRRGNEAVKATA
jgi:hypothetical protein